MNDTSRGAAAKTTTAGGAPAAYSTAAAVTNARNLLAAAHNPGFKPYPNLCWTAGPWKPEYEPWTFAPPHYCDICNCLPDKCTDFALHFSRDPAREAQVNAILEGKNAFRAAADVQAGRTPDEYFPGSNQLQDPDAKRLCFQLGWDVALAQAPRRELILARIARDRSERVLKRVDAFRKRRAAIVLQRAQRSSSKNKKAFHLKVDAYFDALNLSYRQEAAVRNKAARVLQAAARRFRVMYYTRNMAAVAQLVDSL